MYMYSVYTKRENKKDVYHFYSDEVSNLPTDLLEFIENHKNEIQATYCDYFPCSAEYFLKNIVKNT